VRECHRHRSKERLIQTLNPERENSLASLRCSLMRYELTEAIKIAKSLRKINPLLKILETDKATTPTHPQTQSPVTNTLFPHLPLCHTRRGEFPETVGMRHIDDIIKFYKIYICPPAHTQYSHSAHPYHPIPIHLISPDSPNAKKMTNLMEWTGRTKSYHIIHEERKPPRQGPASQPHLMGTYISALAK
jgi:hypothetical protein